MEVRTRTFSRSSPELQSLCSAVAVLFPKVRSILTFGDFARRNTDSCGSTPFSQQLGARSSQQVSSTFLSRRT